MLQYMIDNEIDQFWSSRFPGHCVDRSQTKRLAKEILNEETVDEI